MARPRIARARYRHDWTAAELRERLDYNPATGEFTTRPRKIGGISYFGKTRMPAVTISLKTLKGAWRPYYAHRLAWLWMTGQWPTEEIDHINGDSTDNRWSNLREATHAENNRNKPFYKGTSRFIGASFHKASGLWRADIQHRTIGYFKTREEAASAYAKVAKKLYGKFVHSTLLEYLSTGNSLQNQSSARLTTHKVERRKT